jgi:hypothetical protein
VWYGSDKIVHPSTIDDQRWNVFMSQVVFPTDASGAVSGAAPRSELVKVSPHPVHRNDICLLGTGCITRQGNRNLADFFEITIDRTGAAEIVYNDTSNGLSQPGFTAPGEFLDHAGAPVVTLARQSAGPGLFGTDVWGPSNAPTTGMTAAAGNARYPVIGGAQVPGMDVIGSSMSLSGDTLTVTTKVVDLSNPLATQQKVQAPFLQYVTRWQMGDKIYYAGTARAGSQTSYYAGAARSVDLCSVSACSPKVITYPEAGLGGSAEEGSVTCPAAPSASDPCTITVKVKGEDVGSPQIGSLLEQVGSYSFAASHPQGATTNPQAQVDNVSLEIGGVCCYNFTPSDAPPDPTPAGALRRAGAWTVVPLVLALAVGLVPGLRISRGRRRRP